MGNAGTRRNRSGWLMILLSLVVLISGTVSVLGATPGNKVLVPDISQAEWLIVGPFANPSREEAWSDYEGFHRDYLTETGGEMGARFKKGQIIAGKKVISGVARNGIVDLLGLYSNSANTVAYAYLEVNSPQAQKVALKLGSDDGIKVWLNGALIWANHSHRMVISDQDAVAATLKRGLNRLLVKVEQLTVGWGFSCRMRSLADEAADWAKVKKPGLQTILPHTLITENSQAWCIISATPAFVIPEPVTLFIYDGEGKELASQKGTVGEPIGLQLPAEYEGVINLCAVGAGKLTGVKSPMVLALAGDCRKITTNAIAEARTITKKYIFDQKSEDWSATLTFLADQLEGKMYQSLVTPERNLRAIQSIDNIKKVLQQGAWEAAALRGIRQWAYRSVVDESCQPYTVYLPENYDSQKQYRLLVSLHGHTTDDYYAVKIICDYFQPEDFIIVGAFGRGDMGYYSFGEQDVLDVLSRVQQIYNIDPDGIYLTGESMGGMGTWRLGQFYADRFAAIAPFCGWTGTDYLGNLRNLPVLIVHGNADPMVPFFMDSAAASQLKELGYDVRYAELPGGGHDAWDVWAKTQGEEAIFEYFRKYRRNPWPAEVNARIKYLRYGRQYWVWIKELAPPLGPGTVHAIVKSPREIRVETNGVTSLTLDLRHPKLEQTGEIKINIDNQMFLTSAAQENVRFDFEPGKGWRTGLENETTPKPGASLKSPHLGGGLADLFYRPLIFVYGTQKPERNLILKKAAEMMADFTVTPGIPVGNKVGHFMIKADTEVSEKELQKYNLLLLGNREENRITALLTAKLGDGFPVKLVGDDLLVGNQEFKRSMLALTYPNPWAPQYLAGIMTLPFSREVVEQWAKYANIPLRSFPLNSSAMDCYTLPDVTVAPSLTESKNLMWSFDQEWQELIPLN